MWNRLMIFVLMIAPALMAAEEPLGKLMADLKSNRPQAQATARHLLPRLGVRAVPELIPLLSAEDTIVAKAAFDIVLDIANESTSPGREADRKMVTDLLMPLVTGDRPEPLRIIGLRLLERTVPAGYDVGPIAGILKEKPPLCDKARTALERMGTPEARVALRQAIKNAGAEFQCALLNSLGELQDTDSLDDIKALARADNAAVRAAAVRALSWTGDPANLPVAKSVVASTDDAGRFDAMDALLRLVNAIEAKGGNWQIAVDAYLDLLKTGEGIFKDAALAGLGRMGDGTCVRPIVEAMRDADIRTGLNGIAALRDMKGVDVVRELAAVYSDAPRELQLALIPVLGAKKHPQVIPTLKLAAQSNDAAFRLAGLAALGECGSADGLEILITAARKAAPEDGTMVSRALLSLAGSLQSKGQVKEAGMAYLAALETISDMGRRAEALRGLAACPIPDAFEQVKTMISDKDLQEPAMDALVAVAGTLAAANQKDKALDAYETVRKLNPPVATAQAIAKGLHSLGVKIDLAAMMGLVTRWWVVGPFELDPENKGWANDWIGEPNVKLDASYKSGNKTVSWKSVTTDDANGKIDLRATLADRERCVGYACAEVGVKESCDAVLLIGVDDSERVWVNGQKVYERFVPGGLQVDSDRIPVKLKAGRNTILMKIWQNNLGWEFCARLTLPDGRPVIFQQPEAAN